jgi:hypothetical protein
MAAVPACFDAIAFLLDFVRTMQIVNQANLPADRIAEITASIPHQENLKDLMAWAFSNPHDFSPTVVTEVIVQDEFTHDVVVAWRDGVFLVYDTT